MLVLLHVIIALASLSYTTYAFISPSHYTLRVSYGLVLATLVSGTYLTFTKPAHILQTCLMGLVYIGVVSLGLITARAKLAKTTR